jgi:Tol biopolymer transport system component
MYRETLVSLLVLSVLIGLVSNTIDTAAQSQTLPGNGKIAYEMQDKEGHSKVYLMDADGSNPTFLVDGRVEGWSPDGKQLLLDGGQRVLDLDTGKITTVLPKTVVPGHNIIGTSPPVWSPDGTQIAVVYGFTLYTIKPDGTGLKLLYRFGPEGHTKRRFLLSWSPDSKQLAFPLYGGAHPLISLGPTAAV